MDCYKVVVRPRTVIELLKLKDLQAEWGVPSKCGTEQRDYVEANYGGYFYTRSLEAGLNRLAEVREKVALISPEINVFLKRACTEFEQKYGDSDKWVLDPMADSYEAWCKKNLDEMFYSNYEQSHEAKLNIEATWYLFAAERGDLSYRKLNGGEPLNTPPVTYEVEK